MKHEIEPSRIFYHIPFEEMKKELYSITIEAYCNQGKFNFDNDNPVEFSFNLEKTAYLLKESRFGNLVFGDIIKTFNRGASGEFDLNGNNRRKISMNNITFWFNRVLDDRTKAGIRTLDAEHFKHKKTNLNIAQLVAEHALTPKGRGFSFFVKLASEFISESKYSHIDPLECGNLILKYEKDISVQEKERVKNSPYKAVINDNEINEKAYIKTKEHYKLFK